MTLLPEIPSRRGARRRDRHGRGLRGPLIAPTLPAWRTRSEKFDDLVAELPVPPLPEQAQIADHNRALSDSHDTLVRNCERHISLLTDYRAALINECVTGQRRVGEDSALPTAAGRA